MENTSKKVNSFVKQVVARLKGDDNEVVAQKVARKAMSAIEGQIAALKAQVVDDEQRVEDAQEYLDNMIYPTAVFSDNRVYCQNIVNAHTKLENAQDTLKSTQDSIDFFTTLLKDNF
jgi:predicted ArsR family transcriptional regulator